MITSGAPGAGSIRGRSVAETAHLEIVVAVLEEHLLAAIAALRHVVLDARQDEAGKTGRSFRLASLAV